ncbi:MAG: citrate/2-methylcitrate synthase [Thermoanaerobaculales bacterium]|jgi:citrate synthase|nr:citrate/2-methylcitrate synthase [Thermoanaerobaculales bacterium]
MIGIAAPASPQRYGRGLDGLVAGDTRIAELDGVAGRLLYRGYPIGDLVAHCSFEEVSYLVLNGELPSPDRLEAWRSELVRWRRPPDRAIEALARLPRRAHPLAQYRTMLTVAACHIPEAEDSSLDAQWRRPARILSWTSALAAAAIRHLEGAPPVGPSDELGFAANFLLQSLGRTPTAAEVRAFDASLIVQAEHGLHAAAFAALVVISTGADLGSAVLAGIGALSGARHGGANQLAFEMMAGLADPDQARLWARAALARGQRFPGFGHRVYRCPDPRVRALEPIAEELLSRRGLSERWQVYLALRDEVERALGPRGIFANVDSITGLIYHPIGLPATAFPIPFCLAIQTGWMAHCLEYLPDGAMIEPGAVYLDR